MPYAVSYTHLEVYKRQMWDFSVIKDLLMNPVYTGAIASQKKDYRFKIGTIGEKKPEDWIVVEGQHEPLIDRMSFDIVQDVYKRQTLTETSIPKGAIRRCEIQGRNDTGENWRTDTEMIPKHDNLIGGQSTLCLLYTSRCV